MTFTERAIASYSNLQPHCLWSDNQTLRLFIDDALVGMLRVHASSDYMEVINAATIGGRVGLGHILYAIALVVAKQRGKSLRADRETVLSHSVSLWRKMWDDPTLPRTPIPFDMQKHDYNTELFEELLWTNPSLARFDDWYDWDDSLIRSRIASEQLIPHVFNIGFKASEQLSDFFQHVIQKDAMNAEEQEHVRAFWERRFGCM